jgi:putative nucleotidyltransferase-like protein
MPTLSSLAASRSRNRELELRAAALMILCDPPPRACSTLEDLSAAEWRRLLRWVDTSGLALYFFDRLTDLNLARILPPHVSARFRQNLADNTARTEGLIEDMVRIHREFERASLHYAILKGFTLWPSSVPRPELRSQLDLDFLVAEECAGEARRILENRGYKLRAFSGRSWEFNKNETTDTSLENLYKDVPYRSVELHIEPAVEARSSLLARAEMRSFRDVGIPVLSSADLFLGQGMHAFKHVCSEFSRTSHLVEFRRHVITRHDDKSFWTEVRTRAETSPEVAIALGVVTLLITHVMGSFAPWSFANWTIDRLPESARLWVQLYGERTVLAGFPGSKLYLLLQKELASSGVSPRRSVRQALLPFRLPPLIVHANANETLPMRLRRYCAQFRFILFRLRFHTVEGARYLWESLRWQQHMNEVTS